MTQTYDAFLFEFLMSSVLPGQTEKNISPKLSGQDGGAYQGSGCSGATSDTLSHKTDFQFHQQPRQK